MPLRWPGSGDAAAVPPSRQANPDGRMPLVEHIRELRSRLLKVLLALTVGSIVGWIFFGPVWKFIERPYCKIEIHGRPAGALYGSKTCALFVTGIFDSFFLHLKIAVVVGILISSPVWLYQLWAFVAPGLYRRERRWTYLFVGTAVPLFALGGAFAYLAMTRGLQFLLGLVPNGAVPIITINTYLGYAMAMLLIFGVAFEVPLTLVILNLAGVLTHDRFRKWRRMMIFGVFAFAAVATPSPDPITMLLLAVPCVVLVELAEIAVWANDRRRARRPSPDEGLSPDEAAPLDLDGTDEPARADRR
ncbi:MAG TPA: twin-arginine translocase subunit TatC [Streptosporangiaceae bacterium]|nr:twin-arginine translocase subunit TatC [Streptosporangiaceae bacterium]